MTYILYSATNSNNLEDNLGVAEYSYYFVRERFRVMLQRCHEVYIVTDPEWEVDVIYEELRQQGKPSIFLSFAPPHRTYLGLRCPTIPVFAWEFDVIPNEALDHDPRSDWRCVLAKLGCAITHSEYSAKAVRAAMGEAFPVVSIPAPVWDTWRQGHMASTDSLSATLRFRGSIVDSHDPTRLVAAERVAPTTVPRTRKTLGERARATLHHFAAWYRDAVQDLLPPAATRFISRAGRRTYRLLLPREKHAMMHGNGLPHSDAVAVELQGVVYTSVFNPYDGRKNWPDMVMAFCSAFADREDATLVLKFVHHNNGLAMEMLDRQLSVLPRFKCRVIGIAGFLDDTAYSRLISATTYAVNTSYGEGQCLPLMEFMSCGKPAVAPAHTSMTDYIDEAVAFPIRASLEPCCWPHDPRMVLRAYRYRIDWQSIVDAFRQSYDVAKRQPERYRQMSDAAVLRLGEHCSEQPVRARLDGFVHRVVLSRYEEMAIRGGVGDSAIGLGLSPPRVVRRRCLLDAQPGDRRARPSIRTARADYTRGTSGLQGGATRHAVRDDGQTTSTQGYRYNSSEAGYGGWPSEEPYLALIKQMTINRPNARYLDIGCGLGRIIEIVKPSVASLVGLEPDPERYLACRHGHHDGERIQIFNATSPEYMEGHPGDRFDIIAVSMVLQHVARATCHRILCDVHDLLKLDGRAIIATTHASLERFTFEHDNTSKTAEEFDRYAMDTSSQRHGIPVREFSRTSFCRAITDAGLAIDRWDQFSFVPPEKVEWFARLLKVPAEVLRNFGISQYVIARRGDL